MKLHLKQFINSLSTVSVRILAIGGILCCTLFLGTAVLNFGAFLFAQPYYMMEIAQALGNIASRALVLTFIAAYLADLLKQNSDDK